MNALHTLWLILLFLQACGQIQQPHASIDIYGGQRSLNGDWPSVVALTGSSFLDCSGIALGQTRVILAAHCVDNARKDSLAVFTGETIHNKKWRSKHTVAAMDYSKKYGEVTAEFDELYDFGNLDVEQPFALGDHDFILPPQSEQEILDLIQVGKKVTLVGFGANNDPKTLRFYGIKYEVEATITEIGHSEMRIGGHGKDSCSGDSGGPVFGQLANGIWRVIGITSRGGRCGDGGIYGLLHRYLEDLEFAIPD